MSFEITRRGFVAGVLAKLLHPGPNEPRGFLSEHARTVVHAGELVRHVAYTRVLHWSVAIFFLLALCSGFAIYSPWLFRWLTPVLVGQTRTPSREDW
jgi:hypothetical protein